MDKVYEYLYDAYENGRALLDGEKYVEEISQLVHHSNEFVRADLAKALVNDACQRIYGRYRRKIGQTEKAD